MRYRFLENFSCNGVLYEKGKEYEISAEIVVTIPSGIAEKVTIKKASTEASE